MLRITAFALLFLGVLSQPLAMLCMEQCTGMGMADPTANPVQSIAQPDLRKCCADSPQVTKQWEGKPQPKIIQLGHAQRGVGESLAAGFSHSLPRPVLKQPRGSPLAETFRVLRI